MFTTTSSRTSNIKIVTAGGVEVRMHTVHLNSKLLNARRVYCDYCLKLLDNTFKRSLSTSTLFPVSRLHFVLCSPNLWKQIYLQRDRVRQKCFIVLRVKMLARLNPRGLVHVPVVNRLFKPTLRLQRVHLASIAPQSVRLFNTKHTTFFNKLASSHSRLFATAKEHKEQTTSEPESDISPNVPSTANTTYKSRSAWQDPEFSAWLYGRSKYLMAASFGYATLSGWTYGLGLLGFVLFSECGRALAVKQLNVPTLTVLSNPLSTPTALLSMEKPRSAEESANIAYLSAAGGLGAAFGAGFIGTVVGSQDLINLCAAGYTVCIANFTVPIAAFDGDKFWPHLPTPNWWLQGLTYCGALGVCFVEQIDPVFSGLVLGSAYFGYKGWKDQHSRGGSHWRQFNWREYARCAMYFMMISFTGSVLHNVMRHVCPEELHYDIADMPTKKEGGHAVVEVVKDMAKQQR